MRRALIAGTALAGLWAGSAVAVPGGITPPSPGATPAAIAAALPAAISGMTPAQAAAALGSLGGLPVSGSAPMTGTLLSREIDPADGTGLRFNGNQYYQHYWSGGSSGSPTDTMVNLSTYLGGWANDMGMEHASFGDGVADVSGNGGGLMDWTDNLGTGASGNRNVGTFSFIVGQTPATSGAYAAMQFQAQLNAALPTAAGMGAPVGLGNNGGQMESEFTNARVNANGLYIANLWEPDEIFGQNNGVVENIGSTMVDAVNGAAGTVNPSTANAGRYPGRMTNIGYDVLGNAVRCDFCVGKATSQWAGDAYATLFGAEGVAYGGAQTITPQAQYGMDLRLLQFSASSIAVPGAGIGPSGDLAAHSLTTGSAVQASTATLTGATILDPGNYVTWPTLAVAAPQMGGTTATMTASTVALNGVAGFGATGSGYKTGDVISGIGFGSTAPTWTVASVNGSGGITGLTAGTTTGLSSIPSSPVITTTGGSGTGAVLLVAFSHDYADANWAVAFSQFFATGSGYKAGDVLTIAGDTGTAGQATVTQVSAQGGVMFDSTLTGNTGLKISTAGSLTALASGTYHTTTGGSGSGASLQTLYGVTGVTTTPGSGYLPQPLPLVTPSQSSYGNAWVQPVMTAAAATLNLNPTGGYVAVGSQSNASLVASYGNWYLNQGSLFVAQGSHVNLDSSGNSWVEEDSNGNIVIGTGSTRLFSINPANGNVIAKGTVTQSGSP